MSAPVIPGFSYDPERKRYFKITNGDQRLNAAYSNNAVQAKERRAQQRDLQEQKNTKDIDNSSQIGLISERNRHPQNFSQWLLQRKQGEAMSDPALSERLPLAAIEAYSSPVWPFPYLIGYLRAKNGCLGYISETDFMRPGFVDYDDEPTFQSDPDGSVASNRILRVKTYKEWVSCYYGQSLKITHWTYIFGTEEAHCTDYTLDLLVEMRNFCEKKYWEGLFSKLHKSGLLALFHDNFLIVYLKLGYEMKIELETFRMVDMLVTSPSHDILVKEHDIFCRAGQNVYYVTGGTVVVRSFMGGETNWDFGAAIYGFYVTVLRVAQEQARHLARMYVVTANAIIIRNFLEKSLKRVASDIVIPICNDNQAFPLIHKMGEYILVEEGEGLFKVVDTKRLIARTVKVNIKLASPRVTIPRMFELQNQLFIADSESTYLLGNALNFRILVNRMDLELDLGYEDLDLWDLDKEELEINVLDSNELDLVDLQTSDLSESDYDGLDFEMYSDLD